MSGFSIWTYLGFTVLLGVVFIGIIIYYYSPGRKKKVENPKYRMLDDDEE
jgi:cbb3-type cytochrome oxidase subunit 3